MEKKMEHWKLAMVLADMRELSMVVVIIGKKEQWMEIQMGYTMGRQMVQLKDLR